MVTSFARSRWPNVIGGLSSISSREDRSQGACLPAEKRKDRLKKKKKGNTPQFGLRADLFFMTGTDLAQIHGIDVTTATTIRSEAGWDMSKWKTVDHFVSWLRLCQDNRISGDKIIGTPLGKVGAVLDSCC